MNATLFVRRLSLLAVLVLLGAAAGCLRVDQVLTLEADGGGTMEMTYGLRVEDLKQLEAMSQGVVDPETGEPVAVLPFSFSEDQIRRDFEEAGMEGIKLERVTSSESDGWRSIRMVVRFASLAALAQTEFLADRQVSLVRREDGAYVFQQAPPRDAAMSEEDLESARAMMSGALKGFRAVLKIRVPGDIVESNGDVVEGREATWTLDVAQQEDALERAQRLAMKVVFKGEGLSLQNYSGSGTE